MDVTYGQQVGHERLEARIMKLPDGRHAAEIASITDDTGEAVLWSRILPDESVATITAKVARQWDYFVACRTGGNPGSRPKD
jgi:hypothetical protein